MKLTKENVVGDKYVHVFLDKEGTPFEVETTLAEYEQLATDKHIDPTNPNGTWKLSMSRRKVDTLSGDVEPLEYFVDGLDAIICDDEKRKQWELIDVEKTKIVADILVDVSVLDKPF